MLLALSLPVLGGILWSLERWRPAQRWRFLRRGLGTDLAYWLGSPDIVWHPTEDKIQALMGRTLEQVGAVVLRSGDDQARLREVLGEGVDLPGGLAASFWRANWRWSR